MSCSGSIVADSFAEHQQTVAAAAAQSSVIESAAKEIGDRFVGGGRLYLCGNGGSAADAQHIAAEFVGRFRKNRRALPAVALTTDTSALTAIANDFGAEFCFSRQVEALVSRGDCLWALSVSGRSPNILRAVDAARRIGAFVLGFTGRSGDELASRCDLCFRAPHDRADRVQEVHQLAYHIICNLVEDRFA